LKNASASQQVLVSINELPECGWLCAGKFLYTVGNFRWFLKSGQVMLHDNDQYQTGGQPFASLGLEKLHQVRRNVPDWHRKLRT
jgi:hypothetical protein